MQNTKLYTARVFGVALAAASALSIGGLSARADSVLWDQSAHVSGFSGHDIVNEVFTDSAATSAYIVNDVTFATPVTITEIITYQTPFVNSSPGASVPMALTIFSQSGSLPTGSDTPGNVAGTYNAAYNVLFQDPVGDATFDLTGLNISEAAGSYWIGMTPMEPVSPYGLSYAWKANTTIGDPSAWINPGNGWGQGTSWLTPTGAFTGDAAIKILGNASGTGSTPEPGALALFAGCGLAGFAFRSRRR